MQTTRKVYPFSLRYYVEGTPQTLANGDVIVPDGYWSDPVKCDIVPQGDRAYTSTFEDGAVDDYTWLVILPKTDHRFTTGERVEIDRYGIKKVYPVKGFMEYQFRLHIAL